MHVGLLLRKQAAAGLTRALGFYEEGKQDAQKMEIGGPDKQRCKTPDRVANTENRALLSHQRPEKHLSVDVVEQLRLPSCEPGDGIGQGLSALQNVDQS